MPEQVYRQRPDQKAAQTPRLKPKPPEVMHDFEPLKMEQTSLDNAAPDMMPALSASQMLQLQRTIGNHATKQLIQRAGTPVKVTKPTHLRTSAQLDEASAGETSAVTEKGAVVQRTPINATVAADTNIRAPKSQSMAADDRIVPVKKDQTIIVDSNTRSSKMGPDGRPGGFQTWYRVISISGVSVAEDNMWVHTSAVRKIPVPPAETPAPSPTVAPTPTPSSVSPPPSSVTPDATPTPSSVSMPPSSATPGATPDWLTKTGDSGDLETSMTRSKYTYAGYNTVKAGIRSDYLADAGPEGFNTEDYNASDDVVSPGSIRKGVSSVGKAAVHGAREAMGGGSSGGNPGKATEIFQTAKGFAETSAKAVNTGDWMGWVFRGLQSIVSAITPFVIFATFLKTITGVIDKIIDYRAVKATFERMQVKKEAGALAPTDEAVYNSAKYAVPKVKRGVLERFAFFVGDLAKLILHIITLVSGGASFMATEAAALAITLAQSAKKLVNGIKGAFKAITGTRGKNRSKNAKALVDAAFERQPEALTLLRELNPFPLKEKWITRASTAGSAVVSGLAATGSALGAGMRGVSPMVGMPSAGGGSSSPDVSGDDGRISAYPQNNEEMYARLVAFTTGKDAVENRKKLEKQVASKLKSS